MNDYAEDTHCRNEQTKQDYNDTNEKIPKVLPPSPCCSNLIQYLDKYLSWMLLNSTFTDEDIESFTNIFKLLQLKSHTLEQVKLKCDEVEKGMKEQKQAALSYTNVHDKTMEITKHNSLNKTQSEEGWISSEYLPEGWKSKSMNIRFKIMSSEGFIFESYRGCCRVHEIK